MIDRKSVLALVIARGGSKSVPRKNLRELGGKPLLAWTLEAAAGSRYIDRTVVSTDDVEIMMLAERLGADVPFMRPAELAEDDTPAMDVVRHALATLDCRYDYLALLQPTSPLRTSGDIDGCLALCDSAGAPAAVSVTEATKSPYWMYRLGPELQMTALMPPPRPTRRQDIPSVYELNGAVFVARTEWLATAQDFLGPECRAYVMPAERSIDIDSELDLQFVSAVLRRHIA
jgi:CMP-N,N'-diacetyllegionaminic acid synthase